MGQVHGRGDHSFPGLERYGHPRELCGAGRNDLYVWIRRFESEAERERLYKAVYESDHWKNYIAPQVPDMLFREQIKVTRMEATPKSVIQ
jgi:hypothetical protein